MGRGTADALSRAADTLSGDGDDYIKFAKYVSPEKRKIFNNMMKKGQEYGKGSVKLGGRFLKSKASPLYSVGFSAGMATSIIGDVVIPEVSQKLSKQSKAENL